MKKKRSREHTQVVGYVIVFSAFDFVNHHRFIILDLGTLESFGIGVIPTFYLSLLGACLFFFLEISKCFICSIR